MKAVVANVQQLQLNASYNVADSIRCLTMAVVPNLQVAVTVMCVYQYIRVVHSHYLYALSDYGSSSR